MPTKGDRTRDAVLDTALKLFRKHGFDRTTMREIANEAGMSLGAAYYYFRSKEDIVHAYYERVQELHERALPERWSDSTTLAERLVTTFDTKLDIVERDRKFLGALFRFAAEPDHPLGVFTPATRDIRERSIGLFRRALDGALQKDVDDMLREKLAVGLWLAHLGLLLHLLHDRSAAAKRTRLLAKKLATLAENLSALLALPPARAMMVELLSGLAP
jgi:AcrR family transcriptional regulator